MGLYAPQARRLWLHTVEGRACANVSSMQVPGNTAAHALLHANHPLQGETWRMTKTFVLQLMVQCCMHLRAG